MKTRKLVAISAAFCLLMGIMASPASAYGSHTFEGIDLVFDRPYIAGVLASAYVCITPPKIDTTIQTSTNSSGDKVTITTTYETNVPVLYEYLDGKWYWVSKNGIYNSIGNPCSGGKTSIWFKNFQLNISNNSASQKMSVLLEVATPITHIVTVTKHKVFLGFSKSTSKSTTGGGENILNSKVDVYRSARDACNTLVGNQASFFADSQSYQRRSDIYTNWFPYSFSCD